MEYSLLNRFRGAWLGSIIGQRLKKEEKDASVTATPELLSFEQTVQSQLEKQIALWEACQRSPNILAKSSLSAAFAQLELTSQSQFSEIALLILPVTLYYHDNWSYLASLIALHGKSLQKSAREMEKILVWCYVVRLALRGELTCHSLSERVVVGTRLKQNSIQWLETVRMSCLNGWNISRLIENLSETKQLEIALCLFCFLNNPEDFNLAIRQALFTETETTNITALSGFLSGAYNGITGISSTWRNLWQQENFYWQINDKTRYMIEKWLGINTPSNSKASYFVITAPKILQPRSNLTIISQQDY